jgi:hypothetical protein
VNTDADVADPDLVSKMQSLAMSSSQSIVNDVLKTTITVTLQLVDQDGDPVPDGHLPSPFIYNRVPPADWDAASAVQHKALPGNPGTVNGVLTFVHQLPDIPLNGGPAPTIEVAIGVREWFAPGSPPATFYTEGFDAGIPPTENEKENFRIFSIP